MIEGYKRGPYPKIEVHRSARSNDLICRFDELLALVSDRQWRLPYPVPLFALDDPEPLAEFLADRLAGPTRTAAATKKQADA